MPLSNAPAKKKILIVDDEADLRELLTEELKDYELLEAGDGVEALEQVTLHAPDLIVTDIHMPNLDGLAFLKELRDRSNSTPVILMTGFGDQQKLRTAWILGAFDFLDKPFKMSQLHMLVKLALTEGSAQNLDESRIEEP